MRERQQVVSLAAMREPSLLRFYVSREWLNKFNTFAEPGPITNHTFLCSHGGEGALSVARVQGGWAEPPALPPSAFLRRHPAQQIPLHRRPGGDTATERLGAPLQQVQPPGSLSWRASLPRAGRVLSWAGQEDRWDPSLSPLRQQTRVEAVSGASCTAVSALRHPSAVGVQRHPSSHKGLKTGSSKSLWAPLTESWGCRLQAGLASVSPQPCAQPGPPWACAAWGLPGSSPRPRTLRTCQAWVALQPGRREVP